MSWGPWVVGFGDWTALKDSSQDARNGITNHKEHDYPSGFPERFVGEDAKIETQDRHLGRVDCEFVQDLNSPKTLH